MLSEVLLLIVPCLFDPSTVHVHNDFLLAILTRCQIIVSTPGNCFGILLIV